MKELHEGRLQALPGRFCGSLLGGMVGDIIGAAVEAESAGYIRKTFQNLDQILALKSVPELISGEWEVGRFTDDTQMTLGVAEWLSNDRSLHGKELLATFCRKYEAWRHYGPGARWILEAFPKAQEKWESLATIMFPNGSYGNGSAMRAAPIGLFLHNDLSGIIEIAARSSRVTHSHYLAIQGASLQAAAVAVATRGQCDTAQLLRVLASALDRFDALGQETTTYRCILAKVARGIKNSVTPDDMARVLGNGIKAQEAVPMAIYCVLSNPRSFERAVESAIFLGGDTDTIASMTGAISGAALGAEHIPARWLQRVTETAYTPDFVGRIAMDLYQEGRKRNFRLD